jgi:hypothetical protein
LAKITTVSPPREVRVPTAALGQDPNPSGGTRTHLSSTSTRGGDTGPRAKLFDPQSLLLGEAGDRAAAGIGLDTDELRVVAIPPRRTLGSRRS